MHTPSQKKLTPTAKYVHQSKVVTSPQRWAAGSSFAYVYTKYICILERARLLFLMSSGIEEAGVQARTERLFFLRFKEVETGHRGTLAPITAGRSRWRRRELPESLEFKI